MESIYTKDEVSIVILLQHPDIDINYLTEQKRHVSCRDWDPIPHWKIGPKDDWWRNSEDENDDEDEEESDDDDDDDESKNNSEYYNDDDDDNNNDNKLCITYYGYSALTYAARRGYTSICSYLISVGSTGGSSPVTTASSTAPTVTASAADSGAGAGGSADGRAAYLGLRLDP